MAIISIQHLGPIEDTGRISLTEVMLIIGRQSSGKSTFMKVLCYLRWLEKMLMTTPGNIDDILKKYQSSRRFLKELAQFHHIDSTYFSQRTVILYDGDALTFEWRGDVKGTAKIKMKEKGQLAHYNSKLCYIPSERNLISAVRNINSAYKTRDRDAIFNFLQEWNEAREQYDVSHPLLLSLTDEYQFYSQEGTDYVKLPNKKVITSFYASSGIQSVMPIDLLSHYVLESVGKVAQYSREDLMNRVIEALNQEDDSALFDASVLTEQGMAQLRDKMKYQSGQLFIEEPEQNLYPDAQRVLVQRLVQRLKAVKGRGKQPSLLVMTTHSPYLLSTLNVLLADAAAVAARPDDDRVNNVVDRSTLLPLSAYSAYFINEDGRFVDIKDEEIPMFSGEDLDAVSDWVDHHVAQLNEILYADTDE